MRVALVIDKYDPASGGAECWTHRHGRMLIEDGHEVHIVARTIREAPATAVSHLIKSSSRRLSLADRAATLLSELPVDVIHDMGLGWYADVFMPHCGTRKAIYSQQSKLLAPPERWLRPLAYHLLPRYLRFQALEARQYRDAPGRPGKLFLAVSRMVKTDMVRFNHAPAQRVHVVHNGVDIDRFQPDPTGAARRRIRRDLGITDATTLFLLVAHDWDLKGLQTILQSLAALTRAGRDAALAVVGPGTMRGRKFWGIPLSRPHQRYPRLARQLGCDDAVRFAGLQTDPLPYYQAADVYVQPTLYDACSLVVLEAMACGLPVITSACNGASEMIEDGREGSILDDPQDEADLARRMERYLSAEVRAKAGHAALQTARRHTAMTNYEGVMQMYRQVLAEKASARSALREAAAVPRAATA
jgi:UDP-glucose:(heptosyl)LPS alpha-1,3-glucosyltransferase